MERLRDATVGTTRLDRAALTPGIVHLGIGAFGRAHTADFAEAAMAATGDLRWGITGVAPRSDAVVDRLAPQDGLFSLSLHGPSSPGGEGGGTRVVSSVLGALSGQRDAGRVVAAIGARGTGVVTLTITEKGYRMRSDGSLDVDDPGVRADLGGAVPTTPIGQLVAGLRLRARDDAGPITLLSCDNLPGNGRLLQRLVREFAAAAPDSGADLADWLDERAAFPNGMVDRMVPATTGADLDAAAAALGLRDEAAVVAEPFRQWVVERSALTTGPDWAAAGVQPVDDVAPWERLKLRMVNASHTVLAALGRLDGLRTIAESVGVEAFSSACHRVMVEEVLPTVDGPAGVDGAAYAASVLLRFANPALAHTTAKVGADGSQKLPARLLPTLAAVRATGGTPRWAALGVAAWLRSVATAGPDDLDDPLAPVLVAAASGRSGADAVAALLAVEQVFPPGLSADPVVRDLVVDWYVILQRGGTAAVKEEIRRA